MGQSTDEVAPRHTIVDAPSRFFNQPAPSDDPAGRDIAEHKARIAGKRAEMSATIDSIQAKLEPRRIKDQITASVRGATVGRAQNMFDNTRYGLMDRVRENPVPAAMAAIGLGWLLMRKPDHPSPGWDEGSRPVQSRMGEVTGRTQETAEALRGAAQSRLDDARSTAQDAVGQVQDRAAAVREQAAWQAGRARGGFEQLLQDNPLAVGAIALAVGAAVGLAAPGTPKENEVFGETRDRLMDRAQSMAQDTMQRAQTVAQKVTTQARDTIQEEVGAQSSPGD